MFNEVMGSTVKYSKCKLRDLHSVSRNYIENPDVQVHTYSSNVGRHWQVDPQGSTPARIAELANSRFRDRPFLKTRRQTVTWGTTPDIFYMHVHLCVYIPMNTQGYLCMNTHNTTTNITLSKEALIVLFDISNTVLVIQKQIHTFGFVYIPNKSREN